MVVRMFVFVLRKVDPVKAGCRSFRFAFVPIVLHAVIIRRLFSIVSSAGHQPIAVSSNIYDHLVFSSPEGFSWLRKGVSPFQLQTAARSVEKGRAEARSKGEAKDFRRAPYTKLNDQHSGRPPPPRDQTVSFPLEAVNRPCPARREKEAKREAVYVPEDEPRATCQETLS
ncbi:hypothetical protein DAPPUDRAFT_113797 [Daphnia pulex]|uniref:Uncharacterized protein n=1 Tax=Daphnia pulex TaxID=6669 RepID=E9HG47_DAPPU|nr:hypothetical protein DAPPUDRAFT_113797 [Daphnia pulex]|eukprot:EFX69285.1 hypothetical protein DAPPUDRAFT_113797 [Daphnia pulex]